MALFREADPRYGYCRVIQENEDLTLQLVCAGDDPWLFEDGQYVYNPSAIFTLSPAELIARAVPLGVDASDEGGEATRNRARAETLWPYRSSFADVIDHQCSTDCASINRAPCVVGSQDCGVCLPGHHEFNGDCFGRVEANNTDARHDGKYYAVGQPASPNGAAETAVVDLTPGSDVFRVEVYLTTTNASGAADHQWLDYEGVITKLNEAPPHSLSVTLQHSDGTETVLGDQATPGAIQRIFRTKTIIPSLIFSESDEWVENVESIDVTYQSFDDTYGYDLYEVRTFGTSL